MLEAAQAAGAVLAAYALGLPAVVLIRSAVSCFQGRGDTRTPMLVALAAVAANVPLKFLLTPYFGAAGLALATSTGAWINFLALYILAHRQGVSRPDLAFAKTLAVVVVASLALAVAILSCDPWLQSLTATLPQLQRETRLAALMLIGGLVYASVLLLGARVTGFSLRH